MSDSSYERMPAAILYADVAGYARLTGQDESDTHKQLSESLDLIAERVHNAGGRIVHYAGDAVLASFESVVAATNCAIGIQRATSALRAEYDEERRLLFRIGVNSGEVIVDRGDIYGDDVNLAARLEGVASPGGICVSAAVHDGVVGKVDAQFEDMGALELKNIERPVRAFHISADSLQGDEGDRTPSNLARFSAYPCVTAPRGAGQPSIEFAPPDRPSLMILPFKNLGTDADAPLANGLQLAIQSVFVKLSGLFLISPAAPATYRGREVSAIQAGNEVGIRYVLEGAVQVAAGRLRVIAQLTDAPEARLIWSERYDRVVDDVFEIQDEIATGIVTALHVQLNREDATELKWWEERDLPSWSAREKALRALSHSYKGTKDDNECARQLNEELLAEVPEAARGQGLARIALSHWTDAFRGWSSSRETSLARAGELAEKALELRNDPDGWAHLVLGYIRLFERKFDEALSLSNAASGQRPNCPLSGAISAEVLKYFGQPDKAIEVVKSAVRKARVYPPWMVNILAACYRDVGEFDPSISAAREALRLDSESIDGLVILTTDYSLSGRMDEAERTADQIRQASPDFSIARCCAAQPYRENDRLEMIAHALRGAGLAD